jgi:hypothetical protein
LKKEAKTLATGAVQGWGRKRRAVAACATVFWFFFFKKEPLSFRFVGHA